MAILAHETIEFAANGGTASGYLAKPVEGGPYPGVVVIQEWWGLNPNICDIANRIAAEGYVALAPDLFHGAVTAEPDEAQKLMMTLQEPNALVDMSGAVSALASARRRPLRPDRRHRILPRRRHVVAAGDEQPGRHRRRAVLRRAAAPAWARPATSRAP